MRIPTLLGFVILILGLSIGIMLFYQRQPNQDKNTPISEAENIQVINITSDSATVTWQTKDKTVGYVSYGETSSLGQIQNDIRDNDPPQNHLTHFVVLNNLKSDTPYYFKVRSGPYFYPQSPETFKTAQTPSASSLTENEKFNKPVTGVIVSNSLLPVDEAVVILSVDGISPLGALSSTAGNFILPTVYLYKSNLSELYSLSQKITANLSIFRGEEKSEVKINLPLEIASLPKIVMGQNSDFTNLTSPSAQEASPSAVPQASQSASPSPTFTPNPDVNGDGKVNSLDLTIIIQNLGLKSSNSKFKKEYDLNNDGVIDQKDIDLFKKLLSQ
jgi:hypothetical protein